MKNKNDKFIFITITFIVFFFSIILIFTKKVDFSENENRYLEEFPKISMENFLSGKVTNGIQKYLNDHFPYREKFLFITTKTEMLLRKKIINDVYLGKDDYLITKFDGIDNKEKIINRINNFKLNNSNKEIEILLIPSSISINDDKLPKYAINKNEINEIDNIYSKLNIETINVFDTLKEHNKDNEMFYKTDHHWTSYGAYYSYLEFCKYNQYECTLMNNYNIKKVTDNFNGTLYSKTNKYDNMSDKIYIFDLKNNNYIVNYVYENLYKTSIFEYSYLDKKDKYSMFLDNNHPLITITNNNCNNKKEILLVKDSYGNSFSQFLINDFYKVHIIDLRYYKSSVSKYLNENNNIDKILLLYNVNTLDDDTGLLNLQ